MSEEDICDVCGERISFWWGVNENWCECGCGKKYLGADVA